MKTKERILAAALKLFNEQGTGAVTTNHIAEAAGISPGNLYYHFGNKQEIIRAIFERLFHQWDVALTLPTDRLPTLEDVRELVRVNFRIMGEYRFAYRELLALLTQDRELHERYMLVRERGFAGFRATFEILGDASVLAAPNAQEVVTRLAELIWLISEFWLAEVEVSGQHISEQQMQHGIDAMMLILQPYLRK
jgi:AcrR family transcriptional regulator